MNANSSISSKTIPKTKSYHILKPEEIPAIKEKLVHTAQEILAVPYEVVQYCLMLYNWDLNKLTCDAILDYESFCLKVGIDANPHAHDSEPDSCMTCHSIGLDQIKIACGHHFCPFCWQEYCESEVVDGSRVVIPTCPYDGCHQPVPVSIFEKLLPSSEFAIYRNNIVESFASHSTQLLKCPTSDCPNYIYMESKGDTEARCECGATICLVCRSEAHAPLFCSEANEVKSILWVIENIKDPVKELPSDNVKLCPKCNSPILRTEGSSHMTCQCGHEFCWTCGGTWGKNGCDFSKCGNSDALSEAIEEEKIASDEAVKQVARVEYEASIKFYDRYHKHSVMEQSVKDTMNAAKNKMKRMNKEGGSISKDANFPLFQEAGQCVIDFHRLMKNLYAYAYKFAEAKQDLLFHSISLLENRFKLDSLLIAGFLRFFIAEDYMSDKMCHDMKVLMTNYEQAERKV